MEPTTVATEEFEDIEVWSDGEFVGITVPEDETLMTREETLELIAALQACVDELPEDA